MKFKGILFDFDGTIVDSETVHYKLWNEVVALHDIELSKLVYRDYLLGKSNYQNAVDIIKLYTVDVSIADLLAEKQRLFDLYLQKYKLPLTNNAFEVITQCLQENYILAVVTGSSRVDVLHTLEAHGLRDKFSCIVSKDDVQNAKPAAEPYEKAVRTLNLYKNQCIAIEDSVNGLRSARSAGVQAVAVRSEFSRDRDFAEASAIVDDLPGFLKWLKDQYPLTAKEL